MNFRTILSLNLICNHLKTKNKRIPKYKKGNGVIEDYKSILWRHESSTEMSVANGSTNL